ncbi:hypothetical protein LCGC14_1990610, partial [marine sediment metagenome]
IGDGLLRVRLDLGQQPVDFRLVELLVEFGTRDHFVGQLAQRGDMPIVVGAAVEIDESFVRQFLDFHAAQPHQRQLGERNLAGIDRLITLREKLAVFDTPGPDAGTQFRASSASFLEGIKLGARSKGIAEPKKLSGPPGGPSNRPVKSTGLHPAVESL